MYATATLTEPKGKLGGYGLFVMTPFQTDDGWVVFVDRGFVPFELKAPSARAGSEIEGETTVSGPIRAAIDRSWFMPADDKTGNQWFSRDPKLYAAADGFPPGEVAPYIIDAKFDATLPNGLPQGGETIIDFPNNHLGYALTWFGMAACLVGVYGAYVWGKVRPKRPLDAVS
jgi:surfeit locus 1 family protein